MKMLSAFLVKVSKNINLPKPKNLTCRPVIFLRCQIDKRWKESQKVLFYSSGTFSSFFLTNELVAFSVEVAQNKTSLIGQKSSNVLFFNFSSISSSFLVILIRRKTKRFYLKRFKLNNKIQDFELN